MDRECNKIQNPDNFFIELSRRPDKKAYFYVFDNTSDQIDGFLCKYFDAARKYGVVIEGKIGNPTEGNLAYYEEMMGMEFQMSLGFISSSLKRWLPRMKASQRESISCAIYDSLESLRKSGKTENMLKNAYIKFMCWLYYKFERVVGRLGEEEVPKILYHGSIGSYERMLIDILWGAGCDVVLLPGEFPLKELLEEREKEEQKKKMFGEPPGITGCTNAWIAGKGLEDFLTAPAARGDREDLFYNCYCRINGVEDKLVYVNELYQFYRSLQSEKRHVAVVSGMIPKPAPDEVMKVRRGNYGSFEQMVSELAANIQYPANQKLRGILVKAFAETLTGERKDAGENLNRMLNKAVYLLCWIKRYQDQLFKNWRMPEIGCFIYLGGCRDRNEAMFLKFLARIPVDVLILCPNLNVRCCLEDSLLYEVNHETSMVLDRFPDEGGRASLGTAAYHAERELDSLLYNDSILFRDRQFTKADSVTLKTMDREIKILWGSELKYRLGFDAQDGTVSMPVIFSKLSGVKDRKVEEYWISIKQLMTPETLVVSRVPFISPAMPNPMKMYATEFFKNGKLKRNRIKSHASYPYGFLREEMQEHILDKLELLIAQKLIRGTFENGTEYTIVSVVLNLPKEALRLIQQFDFTKKNPKLIYIAASETLPTLEDSIYAAFLNLVGFDVLFFVPTGYNIEKHFNRKLMEEHQAGDYMYDLEVPDWDRIPSAIRTSWRDKIFKRG